jgi:HNH endonuclease
MPCFEVYAFMSAWPETTLAEKNSRLRRQRIVAARLRGTHTPEEWESLKREFDFRCVKCGNQDDGINRASKISKDHIRPFFMGRSDSINNIQPLCLKCNFNKAAETKNWVKHRRKYGFPKMLKQCDGNRA